MCRKSRDPAQRLSHAQLVKNLHDVGPELNSRTHFAKNRGLLQQIHLPADACAGQGRGKAADTPARDHHVFIHGAFWCCELLPG